MFFPGLVAGEQIGKGDYVRLAADGKVYVTDSPFKTFARAEDDAIPDDEVIAAFFDWHRLMMKTRESVLLSWLQNGMRGRIWQDGPDGECWIDETVDVVGDMIIYQHPAGMRDRCRGMTPGEVTA